MTPHPDDFDQLAGVFDTRIAPSPAFAERLRQRLHTDAESSPESVHKVAHPALPIVTTSQEKLATVQASPEISQRRARRTLRPAWFGSLETAAAAILVFALVFGTIYSLQREPSSNKHGSQIVASPNATPESTANEVNWGGDAGHSWAFDMPSSTSYVFIKQGGESSSFADRQSVISNGTTIVTLHPPSSPTQGAMLEAFSPNETPRWTLDLAVMPGMAIDNEHLYAIRILDSEDKLGSANRQLVAISLETGKIAWTGPDIGTTGKTSFSWAPVVKNGVVFVADAKGSAYALKASDGGSIWESKVPDDAVPDRADGSSVTQTGGVIALNADGVFVAGWVNTIRKLDPQTGKELGTIALPDGTSQYDLQIRGNTLVATGIFDDLNQTVNSMLLAIDTATSDIRWEQRLPTRFSGNLVLLKDRVIVPRVDAGTSGPPISFDSYDFQTGKLVWIPADFLSLKNVAISALDGPVPLLFATGSDGTLTVINADSGDVIAEKSSRFQDDGSNFRPLPVFASGDTLIFVQPDGAWFTITPGSK